MCLVGLAVVSLATTAVAQEYQVGRASMQLPLPLGDCPLPQTSEFQRALYRDLQALYRSSRLILLSAPCEHINDANQFTSTEWSAWSAATVNGEIYELPSNYTPSQVLAGAASKLQRMTTQTLQDQLDEKLKAFNATGTVNFLSVIESTNSALFLVSFGKAQSPDQGQITTASVGGLFFQAFYDAFVQPLPKCCGATQL
jgi:hypothetical protein